MDETQLEDRFAGVLLGTAIGDALGLPMEGMGPQAIARTFPNIDGYALFGRTGFVSDDTEQSALIAQSLARHPTNLDACVRAFKSSLLGWFLRLPWGIGWGTLKACVKIGLGVQRTGTSSAGNGAAMRAAIVGAFSFDDPERRRAWSDALARVTHLDVRAVEGARFVSELTSMLILHTRSVSRRELVEAALVVVEEPSLHAAITAALRFSKAKRSLDEATATLGNTGFVLHSVALATFCFLRFGDEPKIAMIRAIQAGGDTDSNAAIVGAWMGALHGQSGLPSPLIEALNDGPFGRAHLHALASDLVATRSGAMATARYSAARALVRNLALFPVVLAHAVRVAVKGSR